MTLQKLSPSSPSAAPATLPCSTPGCGQIVTLPAGVKPEWIQSKSFGPYCDSCLQLDREKNEREVREAKLVRQRQECLTRLDRLEHEMTQAQIPPKFQDPRWRLPEWMERYVTQDRGVALLGPAGCGKTTALCLLMREHRRRQLREGLERPLVEVAWRFVSFPAFIMALQDAWRRGEEERTAFALLQELAQVERLILDDLGAEKLTDYVRQAIYYLLNEREQWQRVTYLTTNFSMKELDVQFDTRISSRIAGMCDVKGLAGPDLRLQPVRAA